MQQIIITGKPGVGKTTLLNALKKHGFKTINCDKIVDKLYQIHGLGYEIIKDRWGWQFINDEGVDKQALWQSLSNHEVQIIDLNALIHPLINEELQKAQFDFCECPIIGSPFLNNEQFKIIKLDVADEIAIDRLMKRNNITYHRAREIVNLFADNAKTNATFSTTNEIDEAFVQKVINYCQSL